MAHKGVELMDRATNSMCAFVMLDLFRMVADHEAAKRGLAKGSLFLSRQTQRNIQAVALSGVIVTAAPDRFGDPWRYGHLRLSEIAIEEHFGCLRMQQASAQLSAKSFWVAEARQMLKQNQTQKNGTRPVEHATPVLSNAEFFDASTKALRSALRLVGYCANIEEAWVCIGRLVNFLIF